MKRLQTVIEDAIEKMASYSRKGFLRKMLSGRKPAEEFSEIDRDVTQITNDMSLALQINQHTEQQEQLKATYDIQKKIDELGGLKNIQQDERKLKECAAALEIDDVNDLKTELTDCLGRLEQKMDQCNDMMVYVRDMIVAEKGEIMEILKKQFATPPATASASIGIGGSSEKRFEQWKLIASPEFDHSPDALLGSGTYGKVYSGRYRGKPVAIKVFNRKDFEKVDAATLAGLKQEINVHLLLASKSRHIVDIIALSLTPTKLVDDPCIIMEKAVGSLFDLLHSKETHKLQAILEDFNHGDDLMLDNKINMLLQLSSCMEFVVSLGLLHRDIKSGNILLFENLTVKLCDFGFATLADDKFEKELNVHSIYQSSKQFSKGTPM